MPFSIFRALGLGEPKSTTISLQLVDRLIKYPFGVIEDVIAKVDKFYFPGDFIMLDMEEYHNVHLIFGRTFLATGRILIDMKKMRTHLSGDEKVTFNVFQAMKNPLDMVKIDIKGKPVVETSKEDPQKLLSKESN